MMLPCGTGRTRTALTTCLIALWLNTAVAAPPAGEQWLESGLIARGLSCETSYYIRQTEAPGPTVLIIGGMHGNEPAGAEAAEQVRHWPISRGRLVVVPRANPEGIEQSTRRIPDETQEASNLNRDFPSTESDGDVRGDAAKHLWEFVASLRPDWVLDLHEGYDFHAANPKSVGSSLIHDQDDVTTQLAVRIVDALNADIPDEKRKFTRLGQTGPIEGSLVRAAIGHLGSRGMIVETTFKNQCMSLRTRQHRKAIHTLLSELRMAHGPPDLILPEYRDDGMLRVAIYDDVGTGGQGVPNLTRILRDRPKTAVRHVGGSDIRSGVLAQFDVAIFPGGNARKQGEHLGEAGREKVRTFIHEGGGYVGICAGAYLATCRLDAYLKMVRSYHYLPWQTGRGPAVIELTDRGHKLLGGARESRLTVRYANGPLFFHEKGNVPELGLPDFTVLARFVRGVEKDGKRQEAMEGTPAIVSAEFGSGRLVLISPHPESDPGLAWMVTAAIRWAAGGGSRLRSGSRPASIPAGAERENR